MVTSTSMVGVRAPKLVGGPEMWLNTGGKALQIEAGSGSVWLVDFWDYTCVNCIRTLPYIKAWHSRYAPLGLVIIGIHTPEFSFAAKRENVEQAMKEFGLEHPILMDNDYQNWQAFANRYWPRKYLVDSQGYIIYDHAGEGAYGETEEAIQQQIRSVRPEANLPEIMEPVRGADMSGAVCYPMTPELYAGYQRGQLGNVEGYRPNMVVDYTDPGVHRDGVIYAHGQWFNGSEFLRHARKTEMSRDYLAIRYHALEVNAVIRSSNGEPFDVTVTQDGEPVDLRDKGADIRHRDGASYFHVDEPRMYRIIKNREFGIHELKLASQSDSFEIYAFTFGSCEEPD